MTYVQALFGRLKVIAADLVQLTNSPVTRAAFRNASLEKKMINLHDRIADDPEYHICRMFLQFEQHGAIINYEAYILEDLGFLKSEPYYWSEIKDPIKIFKMTFKAKKSSLKFRRDWAKKYVPKYDLKSDEIPDLYDLTAFDDNQWGLSLERLNREAEDWCLDLALDRSV